MTNLQHSLKDAIKTPHLNKRSIKKTVKSPVGRLLIICLVMLLYGLCLTVIPGLGTNSGSNGYECAGEDFDDLPFCICPRSTLCVKNATSMVFLTFSRLAAYFMYPLMVLLFLSKCHNLRTGMQRTYLSVFLPLDDLHHLHSVAGIVIGFLTAWHSFWHITRWVYNDESELLYTHITGRTGLVSLSLTPIIICPMYFPTLRSYFKFEWRKAAHYLSLIWGLAICFHAPKRHIGIVMGTSIGIYCLDWIYGMFVNVHHLATLHMTRIGAGAVEIYWDNPKGFVNPGAGYVYICLPWISKFEWHAFSLIRGKDPNTSEICMATVGDFTKEVHSYLHKPCVRPGWVYGPFPSPFSTGGSYDNLITVASGIGITPAISTIVSLAEHRKVHLIWMCRDADLVEFYMMNIPFDDDAWSWIFYTGTRKLDLGDKPENSRVKIVLGRPDLESLITAIVDNVVNGEDMPERLMMRARQAEEELYNRNDTAHFCDSLEHAMVTYSGEELYMMAMEATGRDADGLDHGVSIQGFITMIRENVDKTGLMSDKQLSDAFKIVDTSGDGSLDLFEIEHIINSLRNAKVNGRGSISRMSKSSSMESLQTPKMSMSKSSSTESFRKLQANREQSILREKEIMEKEMMKEKEVKEVKFKSDVLQLPPPQPLKGVTLGAEEPMQGIIPPMPRKLSRNFHHVLGQDESIKASVRELNKTDIKKMVTGWQMMYCGGAAPVVEQLQVINKKYYIPLKIESFAW